jgi:hypothetical protein
LRKLFVTGQWSRQTWACGLLDQAKTMEESVMTELLCKLVEARLPARFKSPEEVALVRDLIKEGYVLGVATAPDVETQFATVMLLTRRGLGIVQNMQSAQQIFLSGRAAW